MEIKSVNNGSEYSNDVECSTTLSRDGRLQYHLSFMMVHDMLWELLVWFLQCFRRYKNYQI